MSSATPTMKHRMAVIGGGSWGTALAVIIADNIVKYPDEFDPIVTLYMHHELIDGLPISEVVNSSRINSKYLPGVSLPANLNCTSDLNSASSNATLMLFTTPSVHLPRLLRGLPTLTVVSAVSAIKGFAFTPTLQVATSSICEALGSVDTMALSGANIALQVATGVYSTSTLAHSPMSLHVDTWLRALSCDRFGVTPVCDLIGVQVAGALKNVVALGVGFAQALGGASDNLNSAVMTTGLQEMRAFKATFFPTSSSATGVSDDDLSTWLSSAGVGDLIATCGGGRSRAAAAAFITSASATWEEISRDVLGGQTLEGVDTVRSVVVVIASAGQEERFPLFMAIGRIAARESGPHALVEALRVHARKSKSTAPAVVAQLPASASA